MQRPTFPRGLGLASGTSSSPFLFPGMWGAGGKGTQRHVNILQPLPIHSLRGTGLGEEKGGSWRKLPSASIRRCHEPHFKPGDTTAGEGGGRARVQTQGGPTVTEAPSHPACCLRALPTATAKQELGSASVRSASVLSDFTAPTTCVILTPSLQYGHTCSEKLKQFTTYTTYSNLWSNFLKNQLIS